MCQGLDNLVVARCQSKAGRAGRLRHRTEHISFHLLCLLAEYSDLALYSVPVACYSLLEGKAGEGWRLAEGFAGADGSLCRGGK